MKKLQSLYLKFKNEPGHDKTNKMSVCPAKTQISLGIRPVWSESLLCTQWVAKIPSFLHADSEDWSDWAHTHFVSFVMLQLRFVFTIVMHPKDADGMANRVDPD